MPSAHHVPSNLSPLIISSAALPLIHLGPPAIVAPSAVSITATTAPSALSNLAVQRSGSDDLQSLEDLKAEYVAQIRALVRCCVLLQSLRFPASVPLCSLAQEVLHYSTSRDAVLAYASSTHLRVRRRRWFARPSSPKPSVACTKRSRRRCLQTGFVSTLAKHPQTFGTCDTRHGGHLTQPVTDSEWRASLALGRVYSSLIAILHARVQRPQVV